MADHPACVGGQQHKCLRMVGSQASVCLAEVSTLGGGGSSGICSAVNHA